MGIEDINSVISDYLCHLFGFFLIFLNKCKGHSGGISLFLCFCSFVERRNFRSANNYFLSATNSPSFSHSVPFLLLPQEFTCSAVIWIVTQ